MSDITKIVDWRKEPGMLNNSYGPSIWYVHFDRNRHICPPGMKVYRCISHHFPSRYTGEREALCHNRNDFLELLGVWNRMNPSEYAYFPNDNPAEQYPGNEAWLTVLLNEYAKP